MLLSVDLNITTVAHVLTQLKDFLAIARSLLKKKQKTTKQTKNKNLVIALGGPDPHIFLFFDTDTSPLSELKPAC